MSKAFAYPFEQLYERVFRANICVTIVFLIP